MTGHDPVTVAAAAFAENMYKKKDCRKKNVITNKITFMQIRNK